jgi:hypothetical protein
MPLATQDWLHPVIPPIRVLNGARTMPHASIHGGINHMVAGVFLSESLVGGISALSSAPPGRRYVRRNQQAKQ